MENRNLGHGRLTSLDLHGLIACSLARYLVDRITSDSDDLPNLVRWTPSGRCDVDVWIDALPAVLAVSAAPRGRRWPSFQSRELKRGYLGNLTSMAWPASALGIGIRVGPGRLPGHWGRNLFLATKLGTTFHGASGHEEHGKSLARDES